MPATAPLTLGGFRESAFGALRVCALVALGPMGAACVYSGPPRPDVAGDASTALDILPLPDLDVATDASTIPDARDTASPFDRPPPRDATPPPSDARDAEPAVDVPVTPVDAGPPPDRTLGPPQIGSAAYYDAVGVVACENLEGGAADTMVTAINAADYDGSAACGSCLRVTGPRGSVVVRVVDRCGSCTTNGLVLNRPAFTAIALLSAGRVTVSWQPVTCDVMGQPIEYRLRESSTASFLSVQVRNHRLPILRVEVMVAGTFRTMARQLNNYFTLSGAGAGPFTFRVTASDGQTVTDSGITLSPGTVQSGSVQFR